MNRLEEVKKRRPFARWDLLVYGILVLFIAALFLGFALGGDRGEVEGFYLSVDGKTVFSYSFDGKSSVAEGWEARVSSAREGGIVAVRVQTEKGFNVLQIDGDKRSAKMIDSDCSRHKDCVAMAAVSRRDGVIVCVPHAVKVLAIGGSEDYSRPSVG